MQTVITLPSNLIIFLPCLLHFVWKLTMYDLLMILLLKVASFIMPKTFAKSF